MDGSLPGSSVHGVFQAVVLEWIAISFSRVSSRPRDQTWVSRIVDRRFTIWATREANVRSAYYMSEMVRCFTDIIYNPHKIPAEVAFVIPLYSLGKLGLEGVETCSGSHTVRCASRIPAAVMTYSMEDEAFGVAPVSRPHDSRSWSPGISVLLFLKAG